MSRLDVKVLLILIALMIFQGVYYYPKLPSNVASHFNAAGQPDEWSSKQAFFVGNIALAFSIPLLFVGIGLLLRKVPVSLINLPNKDYWLTPERKDETFNTLSVQLNWLACATMGFMLALFQLIIEANLSSSQSLGMMPWLILTIYLVFTAVWLVRLVRRFQKTPEQ